MIIVQYIMLSRGLRTITRRNFGYFAPRNVPNYLSPESWTDKMVENYQYNWKIERLEQLIKYPDEQQLLESRDIDILNGLRDNLQSSVDNTNQRKSNQYQYIDESKKVIERLENNIVTDNDIKICSNLVNRKIDKMYKIIDIYNENIDKNNKLLENISQIIQNIKK